MRILWLTVDRDWRVAVIFQPLMRAMTGIADVTVCSHKRWVQANSAAGLDGQGRHLDVAWVNREFDVVFTDAIFGYMGEAWNKITALKCVLIEDCHNDMPEIYVGRAYRDFGFDAFFYRYRYGFAHHHGYVDKPSFWLPHSIDPKVFHPGDELAVRGTKVLSVGVTRADVYPWRFKACRELKGMPGYKLIPRPPEGQEDPHPVGAEYADELRNAEIVVSGCSIYSYPILKTFEIPACGAVLACNEIDELAGLGFVDGETYIAFKEISEGSVRELMEHWLAPKQARELGRIAAAGTRLVHDMHTAATRAEQLKHELSTLLEAR